MVLACDPHACTPTLAATGTVSPGSYVSKTANCAVRVFVDLLF